MNNGVYRNRRPELVLDEIRMVIADYNAALRPNPLARAAGILGRGLGKSYHNVRKSLRGKQTLRQAALRTVEEALYGDKRLAIRSLFFDDDTWNLGASRIRTLCAGLEKIGLPWTMMGRTDVSSPALYDRMVESGCVGMRFGVESFNQRLLDNVKKNMNGNKNYDMVECLITRYSNMEFHFTTMKNLPGETEADWREDLHKLNTLKEIGARRNNVIHWQNSDCVAFPGTELWEEMVSRGRGDQLRNFELFDASVQNTEKLASEVRWLGENYEARWSDYSGLGKPTLLPEDTPIDEPVHPPGSAPRSD